MRHIDEIFQRVVVKVGTSSLVDEAGALDRNKMRKLVKELAELKKNNIEVVLVTSGAIRAGMEMLGLEERPATIPEKQAVASVGQGMLMTLYTALFRGYNIRVGQILVTRDDFNDRVRYLNACNTINALFRMGCVPVVNENDTVSIAEIKFGDNDTLSALVAAGIDADLLIILSDVEGLYDTNPNKNPNCVLIEEVEKITPEIEALAGDTSGLCGTGGMKTKIDAAKIVTASGARMVIASAERKNVITDIVNGKKTGTLFLSRSVGIKQKKRWIAFGHRVKGSIMVNDGAKKMISESGKSLLAAGIIDISGNFKTGDLVALVDENSCRFARGLTNYSANEVAAIKGKHTWEMDDILEHKDFDEVIHRDNLVVGV